MSLVLVVDTSSRPFCVVLGNERHVLFNSAKLHPKEDQRDLLAMVSEALTTINRSSGDLGAIAVNVGPGSLSSVRSGVSFSNALSYGLGIPVCPISTLELMGFAATEKSGLPVLCTIRASHGNAYVGIYDRGAIQVMLFGPLEELVARTAAHMPEFTVAGHHRRQVQSMCPGAMILDSGIETSDATIFLRMTYQVEERGRLFPSLAIPLTEESEVLSEFCQFRH